MSLAKTLKKRYNSVHTFFGEFLLGPRGGLSIPAHSIIACAACGEFIAFTTDEVPDSPGRTSFIRLREYRNRFGVIPGEKLHVSPILTYSKAGWLCPICGSPPHLGDDLLYLPVGPMCLLMALNNWSENGKE